MHPLTVNRSARNRPRSDSSRLLSWTLVLSALTAAPAHSQHDGVAAVRAYREANAPQILTQFAEFLAIPNVASDSAGIWRNASYIRAALSARGVQARLLTVPNTPPVVYGELNAPGAERTLVVYAHYDGQPVDSARWTNPPWQPVLYSAALDEGGQRIPFPPAGAAVNPEWRLYARSASDDKAPIAALLAALDGLAAAGLRPTSNIKFFFEGEEEAGSPNLARILETYPDEARGDVWLIMDGPVHQSRRPQLFFGVRGYSGLDITIYGARRNLHSGHYGNWAPNPALALARLLAGMKNDRGDVLIEGFYDTVEPVGEAERRAIAAVPEFDEALRRELGLAATEADNAPYLERLLLPSLNIRGLQSASVGATAQNVLPSTATASLDVRLVKGNDPEHMLDLIERHISKQGYHVVREDPDLATRLRHPRIARVDRRPGYPAARTNLDQPMTALLLQAVNAVAPGNAILVPTLGGSVPLYLFADGLRKPVIGVPIANHDNNQHAADENLRLANLWYGIDLLGALLTLPARAGAAVGTR